ncbi:MAG: helix-turn-helix transcriptional regulator [Lachnospiraceae bacterium]|nr:helix-turn-helix transcriptional regulator [Lachnospiraceae bacterium]
MIVFDAITFGKTIRKRRKELGYTQAMVAQHTGFSVSFISDLERGKSTAELEKAIYLANMLGMNVELNVRGKR